LGTPEQNEFPPDRYTNTNLYRRFDRIVPAGSKNRNEIQSFIGRDMVLAPMRGFKPVRKKK
jgi:hypothetical protein